MTFRQFNIKFKKYVFIAFACMLTFAANSATEEVISEKRIGVAMRMIGHEVLMCLGDSESRIMPIEKVGGHYTLESYRVPFEFEFGFDPSDIVSIVDRVMKETGVATEYFVEVEQCATKKIVHSYEMKEATDTEFVACRGRILPVDCYSLIITLLDSASPGDRLLLASTDSLSADSWPLITSENKKAIPFKSTLLVVPFLLLVGFIGYAVRRKNPVETDPNLILIGASQFDKRHMVLSFENKKVTLSNKEAELLSLLHASANKPVERDVILQRVWGDEGDYVGRTLDVFISKLRKKLEADASVKIVNIRSVGYKLIM